MFSQEMQERLLKMSFIPKMNDVERHLLAQKEYVLLFRSCVPLCHAAWLPRD